MGSEEHTHGLDCSGEASELTDTENNGIEEVKAKVQSLADKAWRDCRGCYITYLAMFSRLVDEYVTSTTSQNVRGEIFTQACSHDYHLKSEIQRLEIPDNHTISR
jgi:hypothetical protein